MKISKSRKIGAVCTLYTFWFYDVVHRIWLPVRSVIKPSTSIVPQFGEGALGKWDEERNFIVTDEVPFTFSYSSSCIRSASFFFQSYFDILRWKPSGSCVVIVSYVSFVFFVPICDCLTFLLFLYSWSHLMKDHNLCWGITFFITSQLKKTMVHQKNCTRREIFKYLSKKICFYKCYMKDYL